MHGAIVLFEIMTYMLPLAESAKIDKEAETAS